MIRFALVCEQGHAFDAWFSSSASYDEQSEAEVIVCPACGSTEVRKAPMAPAVLRGRSKRQVPERESPGAPGREQGHAYLKGLCQYLKTNADDVGKDFSEEARKIHHGEKEARNIYGEATLDEAKSLHEEGIPALPLPKLPEEHN